MGDVKIILARRSPPRGRVQCEREEDSDIDIDVNNIRNHYRRITAGAAPAEPPGPQAEADKRQFCADKISTQKMYQFAFYPPLHEPS